MAAFLQNTLCRLSGTVTGKSTAGATITVKSRGVLGTACHGARGPAGVSRGETD